MNNPKGIIIAAPASGSGKTTVTLALLRCLRDQGINVASAKVGPDYIDPGFHSAASHRVCYNLDSWAMRPATLSHLLYQCGTDADFIIAEGVMGLFDGAPDGRGSTADLASITGWPVLLVVDAQGMAASAAALVQGFAQFRSDIQLAGVIFNRIGGPGHARLLREACEPLAYPVIGCLPRHAELALPDRHLGLVLAREHPQLEDFFSRASALVQEHIDIDNLLSLIKPALVEPCVVTPPLPVLGQRIAVANDSVFAFCYPFILDGWHQAGAEILSFSPLADEAPHACADAVYLPGGYPELYAGQLAGNRTFISGLQTAAQRGAVIYGECGGYMVLGRSLIDADAVTHKMIGLLPVDTSFADRQLHLGYRHFTLASSGPLGNTGAQYSGHEFHFSKQLSEPVDSPLFFASDARGQELGGMGVQIGNVMGSYAHLIDRCEHA